MEAISQFGGIAVVLAHNTTEYTAADWQLLLNTAKNYPEINVTDLDTAVNSIKTGGNWSTSDNKTYARAWTDQSDYSLQPTSPAIDAGVATSSTIDFEGNKIYGTPDIGGYEYQPPHTIGTNNINIGAGARIYGDGKFRDVGTIGANTADIKITPSGGTFTETTSPIPAWLDVAVSTWSNTGNHHKAWTESNAEALLTNTDHTIGDLENNKYYNITVDTHVTNLTGTGCIALNDKLSCKSNGSGKISFTYGGTYSTHTFDVTEGDNTAPTTTAAPTGGTFNTDQTVTLSCSDGFGTGCDKTYYSMDGSNPTIEYSSAISIPSNATTILKYYSKDLTGNSETIKSQTYIIDTIAPNTTINSNPKALINSNSATFTFSSDDGSATFQCKMDSGAYATCTSPKNYTSLAEGEHTFTVKAKDSANNEDQTPATNIFAVDTQAPTISNASPNNQTFSNTTTSTNLTLNTTETAICRYAATSGTDYASMTSFDTTNNTSHSTFISGLNIGTTYDYYILCQDTATNESGEEHLTFSIAPTENNNISLENIKIKVGREINKFKDTIRIAKNKLRLKQEDASLANGTVKIYKDNKRIETIDINSDGSWDKILKLKDEFSGWIKIRQYDQFGTLISTDKAKINVDTEDPKFNEAIPEKLTLGRNQKIQFTATDDNSGIDYYKVKLADIRDWRQQNEDFYQIPEDVPIGTYDLFIRAYDKTGNYAEEKTTLNIVRFKKSVDIASVSLNPQSNQETNNQNTESQIQSHTDKNTDTAPNNSSSSNPPSPQPQSQPSTSHWWNPFSWF